MKHNNFILSPISETLENVIAASRGIGFGIETYPLSDYLMQSTLIRMTGAQEQKAKCICWELATNDFEYRYERFTRTRLGECSDYREKNIIYQDLLKQIRKYDNTFSLSSSINKGNILTNTTNTIKSIFLDSNIIAWQQESFNDYEENWTKIETKHFANDFKNLFTSTSEGSISLQKIYKNHLYRQRNKIAHNTKSYQENLPTLKTLVAKDYTYENYFLFFSILTLIDNIYIELYKEYLKNLNHN